MDQCRAAILTGPRGPFVIVELTERQHGQLSGDDRQRIVRCFRDKYRNLPVIFVTAGASTLHAMHGVEVTEELRSCLKTQPTALYPWHQFEPTPTGIEVQ